MADVPKIPVCMSNDVGAGKLLAVIGKIIKEQSDLNVGGSKKPVYILNGEFLQCDNLTDVSVSQKTTDGDHVASIIVDGSEYKIYNGVSGGGGTTENICVPLLTPLWFDHDPGDSSWIASYTGDLNYSTGAGFFAKANQSKVYAHLYAEYTTAAATASNKKTISFPYPSESSPTTITYWETADGHRICMTDQITNLNTLFGADSVGTAWFYVLDTTYERFALPRTKYGLHGSMSYVKRTQAGENTMSLYFYNGNGPTSDDKMDKVQSGIGPFTSTAVRENVATFRDEGQVEDSGHKIIGVGTEASTDLITLSYITRMLKVVTYAAYADGSSFTTTGGDFSTSMPGVYGKTVTIPTGLISGYVPVGIVGISMSGAVISWREFSVIQSGSNWQLRIIGKCLVDGTSCVNVKILCAKSWAVAS